MHVKNQPNDSTSDGISLKNHLVHDQPASVDSFGSHSRTANAISHLINNEDGGIAIALEGNWGSGKSTIINLLKAKHDDEFFIFDAWAHEGDPLRRIFLESIIDYSLPLLPKKLKEKWTKKKLNLSKISKDISTTSEPCAPHFASFAIAYAIVLPLASLYLIIGLRSGDTLSLIHWICFGLIGIPAIYGIIDGIRLSISKNRKNGTLSYRDLGLLAIFSNKYDKHIQSSSIESADTTSIEFQAVFTDLLSDVLNNDPKRKLVIVLDNLDRVPEDSATSIWASLRVFMDCWEKPEHHDWAKRTWLLVPYDRISIERLWKPEQSSGDPGKSTPTTPSTPAAFLDKTFQVRFEAPPLILSDWRSYLGNLLNEAFPDLLDDTQLHRTYRLSAIVSEEKRRPPTPRHLKLYVNDICALRIQFGELFPLHHLAYYTLLRRRNIHISQGLLSGEVPEEKFRPVLENGIEDHLAAILFNTLDTDQARDLLLKLPIISALKDGHDKELKELSRRKGFWPVAESILPIFSSEIENSKQITVKACRAANASGISSSDDVAATHTLQLFALNIIQETSWGKLDSDTSTALVSLLQLTKSKDVFNAAVAVINRIVTNIDLDNANSILPADEWAKHIVPFLTAASKCKCDNKTQPIKFNTNSNEAHIAVFARLQQSQVSESTLARIRPNCSAASLVQAYVDNSDLGSWSYYYTDGLHGTLRAKYTNLDWAPLMSKLSESLQTTSVIESEDLYAILAAIKLLIKYSSKSVSSETLKSTAESGYLVHHMNRPKEPNEAETLASLILCQGTILTLTTKTTDIGDSPKGRSWLNELINSPKGHPQVVEELITQLHTVNGELFLINLLDNTSTHLFAATLLDRLFENKLLTKYFTYSALRSHWIPVFRSLESENYTGDTSYEDIVELYITDTPLLTKLTESDFNIAEADLHIDLVNAGALSNKNYNPWLVNQMPHVADDSWLESIVNEDEDDLIRCLLACNKQGTNIRLGSNLNEAILNSAKLLIAGQWGGQVDTSNLKQLIQSLDEERIKVLGKNLLDRINQPNLDFDIDTYFDLYGDFLPSPSKCAKPEYCVRLVCLEIVRKSAANGFAWLETHFANDASQTNYYHAPSEDVDSLRSSVLEYLKNNPETQNDLTNLIRVLQIDPQDIAIDPMQPEGSDQNE